MSPASSSHATSSFASTPTEGHIIRWAKWYDRLLALMTLGREGVLRDRMLDDAALNPGEQVLDVGCGTGTLTLAAAARVGSSGYVVGVDPAAEMIARARAKAARSPIGPWLRFETAAVEALPFPDASFDVVLGSLMFHHLPPELQQAGLREIQRVLRPEGRLVILDFSGRGPRLHRVLSRLPLHRGQEHPHGARVSSIMEAAARQAKVLGFDDVEVHPLRPRFLCALHARRPAED